MMWIEHYNKETKTLIIPEKFNQKLKDIPEGTKIIIFGRNGYIDTKFNQPINNLPNSITHLTFSNHFNQLVDNLPNSITHLTFGRHFNQSVDELPNSITHLIFGSAFNQSVDNLPKNLTHLTFGWYFNQSVDKLPKNLTHLTLSGIFNQPVNYLPESLIVLKLFCDIIIEIPKNVKELHINSSNFLLNNLPYNIEKLFIKYWVDRKINNLPSTLKEIIIHDFIGDEVMKNITIPFGSIVSIKTCLFNFN